MRPQPDLPRRPSRRDRKADRGPRFAGRGRAILGITLATLFVLLVSLRGIASFYTDYLWFRSLDLTSVWSTVLGAKFSLTLIGAAAFFLLCWGNLTIAERLAPAFRPTSGDDDLIERYHEIVGRRAGTVRFVLAAFLALVVGVSLGSSWNEWILFNNRVDFGQKDATFGTDVGFYVFQLPFLTTVTAWLFSALILVLIVTLMAHVVNGGIRFNTQLDRVTPQVKAHVSVLLGALTLVQGGRYWLDRFQLTFSTRGTVDGAAYTDTNVQLKVIYLLIAISVFAFGLFIANIWRRGWVLPSMAVGLWIFVAVLAGGIVPAFVQRFRVQPAESSMEQPYIRNNITATRQAMNLDVESKEFDFSTDLDAEVLQDNVDVVSNIRLWDPVVMADAFEPQQLRSFYGLSDVDVDRYELDGRLTQVMVGARNLNTDGVPSPKTWEKTHLAYTHGYGVVAARANTKTSSGDPDLLAQDVPVVTSGGFPELEESGIYFGEDKSGYVIVDTDNPEIDYQDDERNTKTTTYTGDDGIEIGSGAGGFVRRAAFALRFGDINPLISGNIQPQSKVLIERDVKARLQAVAPFLAYDHDPYVVVLGGEVKYVTDAYTTTRNFPNAQRADTGGLQDGSGLAGRSFNYARNSVKAVVDAYDGTVDLYIVDKQDPIIKAYDQAFPDLFAPVSEAPEGLEEHFRYPEDLFTIQTQMWARYHVGDPDDFYNGNDAWSIPGEPGVARITTGAATGDTTTGTEPVGADGQELTPNDRYVPQYLLSRLPGESEESFIIMRPFVPSGGGSGSADQRLLTAFMVASGDPDDYGRLTSFETPGDNQPNGPSLVANQMESDPEVRRLRNLVCSGETTCELRNLTMVPVGNSLLYVRSLFARGDDAAVPRLEQIIVSFQGPDGNEIEVDGSLRGALVKLFGEDVPTEIENTRTENAEGGEVTDPEITDPEDPDGTPSTTTPPPTGSQEEQEEELLAQIFTAFDAADAATAAGDQVEFAIQIQRARELVDQLQTLRGETPTGTSGGESGSGGTTTTTDPAVTTTTSAGA